MTNPYADIFAFSDYREFLSAYFKVRSRQEKNFTQSYICRMLGLPNSRSFFGDIIRGQKPLSSQKTENLIEILELLEDEAKYFRTMVLHNQSALPAEKVYHLEKLIHTNPSPSGHLDKKAFEYYGNWCHSTIRALLDVVDIKNDLTPLVQMIFPALSLPKVRASLKLLKKLGLIEETPKGFWKPSGKSIHSGAYMQDQIVKQYQIQCLDIAKIAILNQKTRPQNISTETISVSDTGYKAIERRLQKFKADVRVLVNNDNKPADRVYQLNMQLFPQSK